MPSHATPREAAFFVESTFNETQADWDTNGTELYVLDPDVSGIQQQVLPNENSVPRRLATHDMILGLMSESSMTLGLYMTAAGTNAAETAQAVVTPLAKILKSAFGGQKLGYSVGFSGGTAAAPEIDVDSGSVVAGDWIYAYDTSESTGEFYRVESIAALVLTLNRDLHFTPDPADVAYATIATYLHEPALNNHAHSDHTTTGWQVQGEDSEDVYEGRGCKCAVEIEDITAGEPVKLSVEIAVTSFNPTPTTEAFTTTPSGIAPNVPGTGCDTLYKMADVGGTLASVDTRGSLTPNIGIAWEADKSANGCEGVNGYVATGLGEGGPTIIVDYDRDYDTEFSAQTHKQLYVQVGNDPLATWGIFWPDLEYRAKPVRTDEGGLTSQTLDFIAHESQLSTSGLTEDTQDMSQRRSPVVILIVA